MTVYLDHNATTPVDPRVLERFVEIARDHPANPASVHSAGRRARAVLEDARARCAELVGVAEDRVVFVSGGTEANASAIAGLGDPDLPVWVMPGDHPSVLEPAERRGRVMGEVNAHGEPRFETDQPVGLVCVTHGQSDLGNLPDLGAAAALATAFRAPLHVDAAQALGRVPVAAVFDVADSVALTVHKCGGLRGQGVWIVPEAPEAARPLILGGGHERGLRSGTPSPALAAAAVLAIELAIAEQGARAAQMRAARETFLRGVASARPIELGAENRLPNTAMIAFAGCEARLLLPALDLAGVAVSQGSACSSGSSQPAAILRAIEIDEAIRRGAIRVSFGASTTLEEARRAAAVCAATVTRLRDRT